MSMWLKEGERVVHSQNRTWIKYTNVLWVQGILHGASATAVPVNSLLLHLKAAFVLDLSDCALRAVLVKQCLHADLLRVCLSCWWKKKMYTKI